MLIVVLGATLLLSGCNSRARWEYVEPVVETKCPGGNVRQTRRTVDTHLGRVRNTVVTTDACLE